ERPDALVICEKHDGRTALRRLAADEVQPWLEKYRLGELWTRGQLGGTRWGAARSAWRAGAILAISRSAAVRAFANCWSDAGTRVVCRGWWRAVDGVRRL